MRIERKFGRRGVYPVTGFIISTGFPFGFVTQRRFIEWHNEIVVYPQPRPLDNFAHLLPFAQGRIESRTKSLEAIRMRPAIAVSAATGRIAVQRSTQTGAAPESTTVIMPSQLTRRELFARNSIDPKQS